ncbi:MAG: LytR C-terminal domain-containing protein [Marmoricola sp.]
MTQLRDERGVVAPARMMLAAMVVVAIGGAAYFGTAPQDAAVRVTAATPTPSATPTPTPAPEKAHKAKKATPAVQRSDVYVEVFNNSGISGLAGLTSGKAQSVGWKVVGSDNWYGTIPATTVYYPQRLLPAAKMLARDLGITRIKPAIAPMRFDRLTVILTSDYTS